MKFSQSQLQAINHLNGPMAVIAGPGSGKTAVITHRIRNLIDRHHVDPKSILTVTFTKAAGDEMSQRFHQLPDTEGQSPEFGTFHSIFYKIIRDSSSHSVPEIISENKKVEIIKAEAARYTNAPDLLEQLTDKTLRDIGRFKSGQSNSFSSEISFDIYKNYEKIKSETNYIDYDDILIKAYHLLASDSNTRSKWQNNFKYIQIDEFQDINLLQYRIITLLSQKHRNLFIVGDDDQSIYGFRGSSSDIFSQFFRDHPDASYTALYTNYRCGPHIVNHSAALISNNRVRINKSLQSGSETIKDQITINAYQNSKEEYENIISAIEKYHSGGTPYHEISILLRSYSEVDNLLVLLKQKSIPYFCPLKHSLKDISFIQSDIRTYLRLSIDPDNTMDLMRIINRPYRNISRNALSLSGSIGAYESIAAYYKNNPSIVKQAEKLFSDLKFIKHMPLTLAIEYILKAIGYEKYIEKYIREHPAEAEKCSHTLSSLKKAVSDFSSIEKFIDYAESNSLSEWDSSLTISTSDCINILTMHSSKGLEFDTVFLPGLNKGVMPSSLAKTRDSIEEERRILYVAMTRAKRNLHLSYLKTSHGKQIHPSMFLAELSSL